MTAEPTDPTVYYAALFDAAGVLRNFLRGPRHFMDLNVSMRFPGGCWKPVPEFVADSAAPGGMRRIAFDDVPALADLAEPPPWPTSEDNS